jgi:hypothetical protein
VATVTPVANRAQASRNVSASKRGTESPGELGAGLDKAITLILSWGLLLQFGASGASSSAILLAFSAV